MLPVFKSEFLVDELAGAAASFGLMSGFGWVVAEAEVYYSNYYCYLYSLFQVVLSAPISTFPLTS